MTPVGPWLIPQRPSNRVAVPEGWPCDFRSAGAEFPLLPCRVCGRVIADWRGCPSVQAAAEGPLWDQMHEGEAEALAKIAAHRRDRASRGGHG